MIKNIICLFLLMTVFNRLVSQNIPKDSIKIEVKTFYKSEPAKFVTLSMLRGNEKTYLGTTDYYGVAHIKLPSNDTSLIKINASLIGCDDILSDKVLPKDGMVISLVFTYCMVEDAFEVGGQSKKRRKKRRK